MPNVFKLADVVDMGIEKEKARRDFYAKVAEKFDDEEMKNLFNRLSKWEETHIKKFSEIRKELDEFDTVESYPGEMTAYMDSLVDDKLYSQVKPDNFSEHIEDPVDAITYGIQFEKDAILFFMEMSKYVQSKNKEVIDQLMAEERHHIVYLINMRKKLT
jgi:rubrerythrin